MYNFLYKQASEFLKSSESPLIVQVLLYDCLAFRKVLDEPNYDPEILIIIEGLLS